MPIKIFVSTTRTQGKRRSDFCHVPEGEIVHFPVMECENPKCGCQWSMGGVETFQATTTFEIVEFEGERADLARILFDSIARAGWTKGKGVEACEECAEALADEVIEMASDFPIGAVLERRRDLVRMRRRR